MAKDILLYGTIWEYNALYFFEQIKDALEDDPESELTLRVNVDGGNPDYGMAIIEKIQEMAEQMFVKVGTSLHSMGFFILCFIETARVECIDTTSSVLHRAAYPEWIEGKSDFKGSLYEELLVKMNKDLEKALRNKVDIEVLENLPQLKSKNITVKDIFSLESRVEVLLTASDLKKLKLVNRINRITPSKSAQIKSQVEEFKKCRSLEEFRMAAQTPPVEKKEEPTNIVMTLAELKAQHPGIYNEAVAIGLAQGIAQEKDRVEACLVFNDIDPKGVKAAIESGKPISAKQMAEFTLKATSAEGLKNLAAANAPAVTTVAVSPTAATDKEKKEEAFMQDVYARIGLGKKEAVVKTVVAE